MLLYAGGLDVYKIVESYLIAEKLLKVNSDDIEEVFRCYIHDFVLYSCGSSEENDDTKVRSNKLLLV